MMKLGTVIPHRKKVLLHVQKFRTDNRYGLEILKNCGKRFKTKSQNALRPNPNVSNGYMEENSRRKGGPF